MHASSRLRPAVVVAKERLVLGRAMLKEQHDQGSPGVQTCAGLADLLDAVLLDLYRSTVEELGAKASRRLEAEITLAPHGGYGRRDVAPYSDVDLMLLHAPGAEERVAPFARRLTCSLYDAGLQLGFSVRTPAQACALAMKDATIFTSLVEARSLVGSAELFSAFGLRFRRAAARRSRHLINQVEQSRREEQGQYGETVFLLNPNVKRSRGALRDLQLVRWIAFARCGEAEPARLLQAGLLSKEDYEKLTRAREFLLRLRNELHFHAGRPHDILDMDEQLRIAERYGYRGADGVLPVEEFMQNYFRYTSEVRDVVSHFVAGARTRPGATMFLGALVSRQVEGDFCIGPAHISATRNGRRKLRGDAAQVLRLMDLANRYDKPIDHATWEAVRKDVMERPSIEMSDEAAEWFLSLMSQGNRLADCLRQLHQLRLLEKLVPGIAHARCLLQFNEYHKFTVDEHSIRAVECATELIDDPGPAGEAYRNLKQKRTLHLALLLHDLGKGFADDHSEVAGRLADETSIRLHLPEREAEMLRFLAEKHLSMAHAAFRHDLHDESLVVRFAVEVGSPDVLQMLYVLTCADLSAVGPGVMNNWKLELLTDLYSRTRSYLTDDSPLESARERLRQRRRQLIQQVKDRQHSGWWAQQINALPPAYLLGDSSNQILEELDQLRTLPRNRAVAWGRYLRERRVLQYTIGAHEEITPGVFHKLTGALTSKGQQILSAEIYTLADELVLDRFYVQDTEFSDEPPAERLEEINRALVAALETPSEQPPAFRRLWRPKVGAAKASLDHLPTQVRCDNTTSERFTIFTIFAYDRMGLLYAIARTLFERELSVHVAKIATYLDQVVDVFYVTDQQGNKIHDETRITEIRSRLLEAIAHRSSEDNPAGGGCNMRRG